MKVMASPTTEPSTSTDLDEFLGYLHHRLYVHLYRRVHEQNYPEHLKYTLWAYHGTIKSYLLGLVVFKAPSRATLLTLPPAAIKIIPYCVTVALLNIIRLPGLESHALVANL